MSEKEIIMMTERFFLYVYLGGAILLAAWPGWHMRFRLDKYDWRYNHIWRRFCLFTVFWPVMLLRSKQLLSAPFRHNPNAPQSDTAERARILDRLSLNPPPCSGIIRYMAPGDDAGVFFFQASDIEALINKRIAAHPTFKHRVEHDLLNWVKRRDDSLPPTDVPGSWQYDFQYIAIELLQLGNMQAICRQCDQTYAAEQIEHAKFGAAGWVFEQWECPEKHKLLFANVARFHY